MTGREEQDLQIEKWITNKLKGQPEILTEYMIGLRNRTSMSRKAYLGYLIQFFSYLNRNNIDTIKFRATDINMYLMYLKEKGNKESIRNTKLFAIKSYCDFLEQNEYITHNPAEKIKGDKVERDDDIVYMTREEVKEVKNRTLTYDDPFLAIRDYCIIQLGCSSGLRVSEIRNLNVGDLDFENHVIKCIYGKGMKKRENLILDDKTLVALQKWLFCRSKYVKDPNMEALFVSKKLQRMSVSAMQDVVYKATENLNKHISPHKMRTTCGMTVYNETGDMYLAAEKLGHANPQTTRMYYAKPTKKRMKDIANLTAF